MNIFPCFGVWELYLKFAALSIYALCLYTYMSKGHITIFIHDGSVESCGLRHTDFWLLVHEDLMFETTPKTRLYACIHSAMC
jgi:hypothetical protein